MFIDLLVDTLANHLGRFIRPSDPYQLPQYVDHATETGSQGPSRALHSSGFFNNASHCVINNPTMINNTFSTGKLVLEHLAPHTEPGAAMDSSARNPPPRCHPGTRRKIGGKLGTWLDDLKRSWNMMWLHGPAGTGKSAVAQTFAEYCYDRGRLGAAFFFSRPNERNKPETVIPTLAYQLAFHCRGFNIALSKQLADDPQWMTKTPQVQLKRLIIDPFMTLQEDEHERIKEPFMIILDGLDECEGESPQFEFVSMINEAAQLKNLPLLWLICSRPEAHLEYSFSRVAYCGREELLIDRECWDDVNRYLRHELARIKDEYAYIMPPLWPSVDEFNELSWFTAGLFALASTGTKYIDDRTCANPVKQLKKLLSFFKRAEAIGANNPLANLDLLYTRVLTDVPEEYLLTTWQILAYYTHLPRMPHRDVISAQVLCNFLRVDQGDFYSALRRLHSVIVVPSPEEAPKVPLRFYHASFQDFLKDPNRSGKFAIEKRNAWIDIAKSGLFWHSVYINHFPINPDGPSFAHARHWHTGFPHLEWASSDNEKGISMAIADISLYCGPVFHFLSDKRDEDLSSRIRDLDFRYITHHYFPYLADWLYRQDPSDPIVRTHPSNELDLRLLEYLGIMIGQDRADPATFPWKMLGRPCFCPLHSGLRYDPEVNDPAERRRVYFFIGHGEKTTIVLVVECQNQFDVHTLHLDKDPSLQRIIKYRDSLATLKWNETPDQEKLSTESGANKPLAILDGLYTQILTDVSEESLSTTQRILAYIGCMIRMNIPSHPPAQVLCNFLCIDKSTFYSALQKLHPIIPVPAPEEASEVPLVPFLSSFLDFLLDVNRSGRFVIEEKKAWTDIAKSALFWHSIDTTRFHTDDGLDFDEEHRHASLPNLEWVSPDNEAGVSKGVAKLAIDCWRTFYHLSDETDEDLSSHVRSLDFRYVHHFYFPQLANWLYKQNPSDPIVRTMPLNGSDMRLLVYTRAVICQGHADPAEFPWRKPAGVYRLYFFVGHGEKTVIVLITADQNRRLVHTLNLDKEPSPQQIQVYQNLLVRLKWNETPDWKREELSTETNNPLVPPTDLLYTQILADVPQEYLPITQRILAHFIFLPTAAGHAGLRISAQVLCNFVRIDRNTFYGALEKLHSVIVIPSPEEAFKAPLHFRHASFLDFLLDADRSGRFVIDEQKAWVDIAKSSLFWHSIDTTRFHTNDGWHFDHQHRHASLPNLEWVSPDNEAAVSVGVANLASNCWSVFYRLSDERDEDLSSRVRDLDFRFVNYYRFIRLADWLYRQDPSDPIVRTEPSNELDTRLLEYLGAVTGQGYADPAKFPWKFPDNPAGRRRTYFFVGHGKKTIIVLITENRGDAFAHTLNLDKEPSPQQIKEYQEFLVWWGWIEEPNQELELEVESEEEEIEGGSTASGENQDVAIKPEE